MEEKLTLNKVIYSLKEEFNQYSDDNFFSDEFIAFQIGQIRNDFILRHYNNPTTPLQDSLFSKVCMNLVGYEEQCTESVNILVTDRPLPKLLNLSDKASIKNLSLGGIRLKYINYLNFERVPYFEIGKFSKSQLYYSIDGSGRLILLNSDRQLLNDTIELSILTSNPEEAYNLRCTKGEESDCLDFYDFEYPIDGTTYNVILQTLRQQLLTKFRVPQDKINDSDDETATPNVANDNYRRRRNKDVDNE